MTDGARSDPGAQVTAEVGSDELDMLAQAGRELSDELAGLAPAAPGQVLSLVAERAGYFANAMRYMGLTSLAYLYDHFAAQLQMCVESGQSLDEQAMQSLFDWPLRWARWFEHRQPEQLEAALQVHMLAPWDAPVLLAQARDTLRDLRVVGSRRVERRPDVVGADELSLAIPDDADREVVDHLLRELPALVAQFTDAVSAMADSDFEQLANARRTAHTIKGSANTVGVSGVANFTHALEDLLELHEQSFSEPDPAVVETLGTAADCLAEMVESLCGMGEPPGDALNIYRDVLDTVNRLALDVESRFQQQIRHEEGAAVSVFSEDNDHERNDGQAPNVDQAPDVGQARNDVRPVEDWSELPPLADGDEQRFPAFNITDFELPDLEMPTLSAPETPSAATPAPSPVSVPESVPRDGVQKRHVLPAPESAPVWADWSAPSMAGEAMPVDGLPDFDDGVAPATLASDSHARAGALTVRVPTAIIDQLLESADEALIALSEMQHTIRELSFSHRSLRDDSERLDALSVDLDHLLDEMPSIDSGEPDGDFDPLELERYSELHTVSRRITEAAADSKLLEQQVDHHVERASAIVDKLERVQSAVRESAMRARMVDAGSIAPRLQRAARQAARLAGKQVALEVVGVATAIDGATLQRLIESLAHLVRNAVDHGIEEAEVRQSVGKPDTGKITVSFAREVSALRITVSDDGRGLDLVAIESRARQSGLLSDDAPIDARTAAMLVLAPGFSTRDQPTQLSGRGIGLDVVNQTVRSLRGAIMVTAEAGVGTRVELTLPLQVTSLSAFVLRSATHVIAVSVRGIEQIIADTAAIELVDDGLRLRWQGQWLAVQRLDRVLGLPDGMLSADPAHTPDVVMIIRLLTGVTVGVLVPEPGQARQVVVRTLPDYMPRIAGIDGVTVLGDGAVASVVDLPEMLTTRAGERIDSRRLGRVQQAMPTCLVVDDSVSVRRAMAQFMVDIGLHCEAVADGEEALQSIERQVPDVVVLDLEMPRQNGIELTQALRGDERTRQVPIVMITSRQSEKHRALAMAAGVDVFLTKPYAEDELASVVGACLAGRARSLPGEQS